MSIRRYNPINAGVLMSRIDSYYRNPSGKNRRRIEEMIQSTIAAMKSAEAATAKSNQLIISMFQEFLEYTQEEDEIKTEVLEIEPEERETPLVDPETGEPRFKILHRAFSKNKALLEQLEYLSREISQRREVKILDAKIIMGIDDTTYVRNLLKRLIKKKLLKTKGERSAMKYIWIGGPPQLRAGHAPIPGVRHFEAAKKRVHEIARPHEPGAGLVSVGGVLLPFKVLRFTPSNKTEVDDQLRYLLDRIMRQPKGEVKINEVKAIIELNSTVYAKRLLDRLIKDEFLKTEGMTKAKKYIWTGKRPAWMPDPRRPKLDTSCPKCGKTMRIKGNFLRCPQRGCPGKRGIPTDADTAPAAKTPRLVSQASVISEILNKTANNPTHPYLISALKAEFHIPQTLASLKELLANQPEIEIHRGSVKRVSSIEYKCPLVKSGRRYSSISYATRADGTQPARRAWLQLNRKARGHFTKLFERICEHGKIDDGTKFKRLHGDIWEFKSNTHKRRITCFIEKNVIYLAHIFKKKEDKTPQQEILLAERIRDEHLARERRKSPGKRLRRRNPSPFSSLYGPIYRRNPRQLHQRRYQRNACPW